MNEPQVIAGMLRARTIAVIGLSDDPVKPSHYVSAYLQAQGARILPVNPMLAGQTVLGERVYACLAALPVLPELVNVFRLPRFVPAIVEEMLALGLEALWVQQGIRHEGAAQRAEAGGIRVVMDRCLMTEWRRAQH